MAAPFVVIAHRGDSSAAPENTLQAFDLALLQGFSHFETDCQLTADGVPVVLHDENLGRTNNGSGPAAACSLQQLQQLDAGSWFGPEYAGASIPTLQEVLQKYLPKAHIHLELKSRQVDLPEAVASLIRQQQQQPQHLQQQPQVQALFTVPGLTITSFHLEQLQASKQLLPEVPHGWLIQEVNPDILAQARQSGFEMVCPRANALTPEGVQALLDGGFAVRAWGVKTIELLHHVVSCGVHGATVNWPKQAAEALKA